MGIVGGGDVTHFGYNKSQGLNQDKSSSMFVMAVEPSACLDVGDRGALSSRLGGREGDADDNRYGWSMA